MAHNCLVTKLKAVVDNPSLPILKKTKVVEVISGNGGNFDLQVDLKANVSYTFKKVGAGLLNFYSSRSNRSGGTLLFALDGDGAEYTFTPSNDMRALFITLWNSSDNELYISGTEFVDTSSDVETPESLIIPAQQSAYLNYEFVAGNTYKITTNRTTNKLYVSENGVPIGSVYGECFIFTCSANVTFVSVANNLDSDSVTITGVTKFA